MDATSIYELTDMEQRMFKLFDAEREWLGELIKVMAKSIEAPSTEAFFNRPCFLIRKQNIIMPEPKHIITIKTTRFHLMIGTVSYYGDISRNYSLSMAYYPKEDFYEEDLEYFTEKKDGTDQRCGTMSGKGEWLHWDWCDAWFSEKE